MTFRTVALIVFLLAAAALPKIGPDTATSPSTGPDTDLTWSQPVNGLRGRIDSGGVSEYGLSFLVRLENVSNAPLRMPVDTGCAPRGVSDYQVFVRQRGGPWARVADVALTKPEQRPKSLERFDRWRKERYAPLVLRPGQSALIVLQSDVDRGFAIAAEAKVVLSCPASAGGWRGSLDLPAVTNHQRESSGTALSQRLLFPDVFPPIGRFIDLEMNPSGTEPPITALTHSNQTLAAALSDYDPTAVRTWLEKQFATATDPDFHLFLAALAARSGSVAGISYLRDQMVSTEYKTVRDVDDAIAFALNDSTHRPDEKLLDLAVTALSDRRACEELEENQSGGQKTTLADVAGHSELPYLVGEWHCERAAAALTRLAHGADARWANDALQQVQNDRGSLLDVLRNGEKLGRMDGPWLSPEWFGMAVHRAGKEKLHEALPILLRNLYSPDAVAAVEAIGDPSANPALESLIAKGVPQGHGNSATTDQDTIVQANIALATLQRGDRLPRYWQLLADGGANGRTDLIDRIAGQPDARSVPHLLMTIRDLRFPNAQNRAIEVLSLFRYRSAVAGLIDCFDIPFRKDMGMMGDNTPEMFRSHIAASLSLLTGQSFGTDEKAWTSWMIREGKRDPDLQ